MREAQQPVDDGDDAALKVVAVSSLISQSHAVHLSKSEIGVMRDRGIMHSTCMGGSWLADATWAARIWEGAERLCFTCSCERLPNKVLMCGVPEICTGGRGEGGQFAYRGRAMFAKNNAERTAALQIITIMLA